MNKGLEVIEAQWLFGLPYERFRVLIHPEALIHALIELVDGSVLAQMSPCDMRLPIQYALSYPQRWSSTLPKLSLTEAGALRFFEPDLEQFPCLRLSLHAAQIGGSLCTVLNAANETAVLAFLDGQIMLGDISGIIAETLEKHTLITEPTLEEVLSADQWARRNALESIHQWSLR